jgi:hypothetical protein
MKKSKSLTLTSSRHDRFSVTAEIYSHHAALAELGFSHLVLSAAAQARANGLTDHSEIVDYVNKAVRNYGQVSLKD